MNPWKMFAPAEHTSWKGVHMERDIQEKTAASDLSLVNKQDHFWDSSGSSGPPSSSQDKTTAIFNQSNMEEMFRRP